MQGVTPVDGHVHLHPGVDAARWLDAAAANFRRYANANAGALLLAEMAGVDRFAELATIDQVGSWRIDTTDERESLRAVRHDDELVLIAGRQVRAAEGLEAMAIATTATFEDDRPLEETLAAIGAVGAIPVLLYGVGKWSGQRGRLVRRFLSAERSPRVLVGDSGNRLGIGSTPRLQREAIARGVIVLPGSDPLRLPNQVDRVGSIGFMLPAMLDRSSPARQVRQILGGLGRQPDRFGRYTGLVAFLRAQVAMQIRKHQR